MKKLLIFVLALGFCVICTPPNQAFATGSDSSQTKQSEPPYKAFIVVEALRGEVIEGENASAKRAPASITKLMLASVVMEKIALGDINITDRVTVSRAASLMGGSQVYLKEGEVFTLEELMKAMMISSANDAAYAIGEYAGGSKDEMIRLMNEKAKVLGLLDTQFHTVHGLPQENGQKEDTTSCNDLAILARELVRYPKIIEWSSIRTDTFRDGTFVMTNTNKFLSKFPGADGLKAGYCRNSGFNIVITAKRGDLRLIAVVMGSPTAQVRDAVAKEKLQKAFSHYTMLNIVRKGEVIEQDILLVDGKYRKMKGVTEKSFLYPVANERKGIVAKDVFLPEKLEGEVREGQKLGEMVIRLDNETIGKVNIISPVYVPKANLLTRCVRRLGLNI